MSKTPAKKTDAQYLITSGLIKFKAYGVTYQVKPEDSSFEEVKKQLQAGKTRAAVSAYRGGVKKEVKSGFVTQVDHLYYKGQKLPPIFAEIYHTVLANKAKTEVLSKFFDNIAANPSTKVSMEAFSRFLTKCRMPITAHGTFLAYKKVNGNYHDIYTGKMNNSPGHKVSVGRQQVDDNQHATCSHGLHACTYEYLGSYGTKTDDFIVVVEINPADVVAVPPDYNHTKMRVCAHRSLCTVTEFREILLTKQQDVLGSLPYLLEETYLKLKEKHPHVN